MINHIIQLNSKAYNLNLGIVESFLLLKKHCDDNQLFPRIILIEYYEEFTHHFIELFHKYSFVDYIIVRSKELQTIPNLLCNKDEPFLLHGTTYALIYKLISYKFTNLNWVCWGRGSRINYKNYKSILFTPIKYFLYNKFNSVVTLLDGDKNSLTKQFYLKNVVTIPYYSESSKELEEYICSLKNNYIDCDIKKIYLGNSGHCAEDYIYILDILKPYANKIEVHCMLSYGIDSGSSKWNVLAEKGKDLFGSNFYMDNKYYSYKDYLQYMNEASAYICLRSNQTGLGAIYTMLLLGKKIFINGDNYNHLKQLGAYVTSIQDIENSLLFPLSIQEKDKNFHVINNLGNSYKNKWIDYLNSLLKI